MSTEATGKDQRTYLGVLLTGAPRTGRAALRPGIYFSERCECTVGSNKSSGSFFSSLYETHSSKLLFNMKLEIGYYKCAWTSSVICGA